MLDPADETWWKMAVIYQVYIRSFADGSGDGNGDISGLRSRIPYLAALGVDAVWINPWYPSPQADGGYDVADYFGIDSLYGSLEDADSLIDEAHAADLRVLLDLVPNHTSQAHAWFQAALAGDTDARGRYVFRPGRGPGGELPPNDWASAFGGSAWTRETAPDGGPGEWYLHLFAPEQPDLDWGNPDVQAMFEDVLRFWFDRGVDGFRIDVAHGLAKPSDLPDAGPREPFAHHVEPHPAWDNDDVHDIYRSWRKIADSYDPPRVFVAEAWVPTNERLALYLRNDELHSAFQFDFLETPFKAELLKSAIVDSLATMSEVGAPNTWVLSNHDVPRHVTRYARPQRDARSHGHLDRERPGDGPPDLQLGTDRARAAALLMLALPGSVYLYQGEELGLPEVEDIPDERRMDPLFVGSGGDVRGRDGCRVPLPWTSAGPTFGFSATTVGGGDTWLPQPEGWGAFSAEAQENDPDSTLSLYRSALRVRGDYLTDADVFSWLDSPDGTLAFRRGRFECWLNAGDDPVPLPTAHVLLHSRPDAPVGVLPPASAAWLLN